ncbi:MAG: hypothetical protein LBH32_10680 [Dysgonamonadaceae bacterium]|jgi:hypothetical protein|nr:hypothetical protein [Dysgonamonadaceae bacterium]
MSSNTKMDTSEVFAMFETINSKLDKQPNKQIEVTQVDLSAVNAMTERLEDVIKDVQKPTKVENYYRHTIDIGSSKVFLSMVIMALVILGLSYAIGEQRKTISQYRDNDLKYRHIKMYGQTNEEILYRLERQFKYSDSVRIIRKQVEKYEELVKEQAERIERAKQENKAVKRLQEEVKTVKTQK